MARSSTCPRCAKRLPSTARFCSRCGLGLRPSVWDDGDAPPRMMSGSVPPPYDGPRGPVDMPPAAPAQPYRYDPPPSRGRRATPPPAAEFPAPKPIRSSGGWIVFVILLIFVGRACYTQAERSRPNRSPPPPVQWETKPSDRAGDGRASPRYGGDSRQDAPNSGAKERWE